MAARAAKWLLRIRHSEGVDVMPADPIPVLRERGLLYQVSETGLADAARNDSLSVYCGFDPNAPSLHVGHVMGVMLLAHFQHCGHRPICLVGGGTALVGDPSFKASERPLLPVETVQANAARVREQLGRFLDFSGPNAALMANNIDWLGQAQLLPFLRDVGKHFSVNAMIAKESVRSRLEDREQGISFTEFTYPLLQGYDYLALYDRYGCTVQVGGSDQWGNITAGVDLIRRARGAQAHALTGPLLTTSAGEKMGKSEGNALWLDGDLTPPYTMYQYWINADDQLARRALAAFTFVPLGEIEALAAAAAADPGARPLQRRLAREFVGFVHGRPTAEACQRAAEILFGEDAGAIDAATLREVLRAVPSAPVAAADLEQGLPIAQAAVASGVAASASAARRLVSQRGLYVNNRRWDDPAGRLGPAELLRGEAILLSSGRKNHRALVVSGG